MVEFETFLESILPVLRILGILFMFVLSFIVGFTLTLATVSFMKALRDRDSFYTKSIAVFAVPIVPIFVFLVVLCPPYAIVLDVLFTIFGCVAAKLYMRNDPFYN